MKQIDKTGQAGTDIEVTEVMVQAAASVLACEASEAGISGERGEIACNVLFEALLSGGWKPRPTAELLRRLPYLELHFC